MFFTLQASVVHFHHWREGNLPPNSKCVACKKTCWSSECLAGMRCEWCGVTVSHLTAHLGPACARMHTRTHAHSRTHTHMHTHTHSHTRTLTHTHTETHTHSHRDAHTRTRTHTHTHTQRHTLTHTHTHSRFTSDICAFTSYVYLWSKCTNSWLIKKIFLLVKSREHCSFGYSIIINFFYLNDL